MWLWFNETRANNEVFDAGNEQLEDDIREEINKFMWQEDEIQKDLLENMTKGQLSTFLTNRFFPEGAANDKLNYSSISKAWKILDFSIKAALQFWIEEHPNDNVKYKCDENFNLILDGWKLVKDDGWKTAKEILIGRWWIDMENKTTKFDSNIVRILQDKVHAKVDWKPWAQTIAMVINSLGWDIQQSGISKAVDNHYKNNNDLKTTNIIESNLNGATYTFVADKSIVIEYGKINWETITFDNSGKPICKWYEFAWSGTAYVVSRASVEWSKKNAVGVFWTFIELPDWISLVKDVNWWERYFIHRWETYLNCWLKNDGNWISVWVENNYKQATNWIFSVKWNKLVFIKPTNIDNSYDILWDIQRYCDIPDFDEKIAIVDDYNHKWTAVHYWIHYENINFDDFRDASWKFDLAKRNEKKLEFRRKLIADKLSVKIRGYHYPFDEIFKGVGLSNDDKTKVQNYFKVFSNNEVKISAEKWDTDDWWIHISFDDSWPDKKYHYDLYIKDACDIAKDNWELDEDKLKTWIRNTILDIVKEHF